MALPPDAAVAEDLLTYRNLASGHHQSRLGFARSEADDALLREDPLALSCLADPGGSMPSPLDRASTSIPPRLPHQATAPFNCSPPSRGRRLLVAGTPGARLEDEAADLQNDIRAAAALALSEGHSQAESAVVLGIIQQAVSAAPAGARWHREPLINTLPARADSRRRRDRHHHDAATSVAVSGTRQVMRDHAAGSIWAASIVKVILWRHVRRSGPRDLSSLIGDATSAPTLSRWAASGLDPFSVRRAASCHPRPSAPSRSGQRLYCSGAHSRVVTDLRRWTAGRNADQVSTNRAEVEVVLRRRWTSGFCRRRRIVSRRGET